jgi:hypothetical protein
MKGRGVPTIQSSVHAAKIDEQTDHSHTDGCLLITLQLILEDLARLTTPSHGVDVDVGEV